MRKLIRWITYSTGSVLLLAAVLWTVSRVQGPSAEQERALAMMEQPWHLDGRNAFAALWLLQYDVPESEQAAVAAEDSQRVATIAERWESTPVHDGDTVPALVFKSAATDRYQDLSPNAQDLAMFCGTREAGCYSKVTENFDAYSALITRNEALLARIADLSKYDYYKNEFPNHFTTPMPRLDLGKLRLTQHAVQFATGDLDGALDATCSDIATWRRLGANSDTLIARMIGIAYSTDSYGRLLADLLDSTPQDFALPQSCTEALMPMSPQELSLCQPLRTELKFSVVAGNMKPHWLDRLLSSLLYDEHMTRAARAEGLEPSCSTATMQRIAGDIAPTPDTAIARPAPSRMQCVSNILGCMLMDMGPSAYIDYERRAQDQGARIQLLATLLWLRDSIDGQNEMPLTERLALRPAELKSPTRDIEVSEDGNAIRIRQFDTKSGEYWQIPLPKYLRQNERG